MDMNLFDYFGFEAPEAPEQKEEVKKKTAKKEKAAKGKKTTKAARERKYKLPVTIYTGDKEVTLEEDGEKTEITLTEIKKFLEEEVLGISKDLLALEEKSNGFIVSINRQKAVSKGGITLTRNTKITCRGEVLDISSLLEGESTSITLEQVLTAAKENINQALVSVVLIPTGEDSYELAEGTQPMDVLEKEMETQFLPFVMGAWGQEPVTVTKDEYVKFLKEDLNTEVADVTLYYENLKQYANKIFPCFGGHAKISVRGGENGSVFVYMDAKEKTAENKTPASKKTDKIPTEGVSIGLIFNKIEVCPEMFDGKTEATKEEYIAFIGSMYPEYSPERCEIQYDKEKKLVIPILKGSRKGAMDAFNPMVNSFVYDTLKNEKEYKIFRITGNDNHSYQVEITPVSTTKAPMDGGKEGEFIYKLPKVPSAYIMAVYKFFKRISSIYNTEVMVRLWYNPYSKSYILSVPTQHVTGADIYECMDDTLENHICVAEIHSHNRYHAFFSSVDDDYEKGNKIYAVMGNILDSKPSMAVRAGTRGYYTDIEWNDFVESDTASSIVNGQVDVLSQMLYDISRERIIA